MEKFSLHTKFARTQKNVTLIQIHETANVGVNKKITYFCKSFQAKAYLKQKLVN